LTKLLLWVFVLYLFKNSLCCGFLVFVVIIGFLAVFVGSMVAYASTNVPSIISVDTVWTRADSPYEILGPMLVNNGVVLTIEPGTVVNLNNYHINVNGTLQARGTNSEMILFNGGTIQFLSHSSSYDEQTGSGCILEYADLSDTIINVVSSPKISNNVISQIYVTGSGIVSENKILQRIRVSGLVTVVNNSIVNTMAEMFWIIGGSPLISFNNVKCRLLVSGGAPVISDNTFDDGIHVNSDGGSTKIVDNIINSARNYRVIYVSGVPVTMSGNTITGTGTQIGIKIVGSNNYTVNDNTITKCETSIEAEFNGHLTVERNTITNNQNGISVTFQQPIFKPVQKSSVTIKNNVITDNGGIGVLVNHNETTVTNNTIANNQVGVEVAKSAYIMYNNIYGNEYNLKTKLSGTIDATYNYWGTTDTTTINQTIYDQKYDYTVGTVNFLPILTEQNTQIPEFPSWIILPLFLTATLIVVLVRKRVMKK